MKTSQLSAQITVAPHVKALAVIITIIDGLFGGDRERTLKTVCAHYGYRLER